MMGIAKGQDPQAQNLLLNTPTSIAIVIPSICYVEALTTLEQKEKYNEDFLRRLDIQINEAEPDKTSEKSRLLRSLLNQSRVKFLDRINDIKERFDTAFNQLNKDKK
ncbi:hypothetical protein PI95_021230 [Hassallia byssoidea VB512170]|uniref:Uncharacterized protein n=1 Tax=Hassallia byssoidea VB512170 TaxID=1304833 RepID=A0A846HBM1_9CYAN|nr:hypothetical protein [Hassalia byssoidea VB512170]